MFTIDEKMNYEKIIIQWKEFELPKTNPRHIEINLNQDFITTIIGPRRAGKTYFCFQLINKQLKNGTSRENILYINFEDEKLLGATVEDLDKLYSTYREIFNIAKDQNIYLFLDEIQNVKNWDSWVRRISDTMKNTRLIITGSSSKLLSSEISTKLRGRTLNFVIFPLSFKEILQWKNINYDLKTISYSSQNIEIKKQFREYLMGGGYPGIIFETVPHEQVLKNYYDVMIFRDIIERYKIKDVKKMRVLASLLFDSNSREISYSKLANKMNSIGFKISKNTIIEYIYYFEEAFLFFQNLKYEYSLGKQLGAIKKIYCVDNGLLNAVSFKFSEDLGKLMENLTYLELKRRNKEVYYHRDKKECDFIIKEKDVILNAVQVTKELNDENEKREIDGLIEALEKFNLSEGTMLTYDFEGEKKIKDKTIKIIPLWKWLLE